MIARDLSALALATLGLLACGDDDAEPSPVCGEQGCSADCEALRGDNCDILDEACRQRIFDAVVCVRGTSGALPPVRKITEDEYRNELREGLDEDAGIEEQAYDEAWSTGLSLTGLIAPGVDRDEAAIEEQAAFVAGYYSGSTGMITLIDRDRAEDGDDAQALLVHELVHALQDQEMGLFELYDRTGRSNDAWYARTCLVEGEAQLYEELAVSLLQGLPVDPAYWDVSLDWYAKYQRGQVAIAPSPSAALQRLTYAVGSRFLTDAWLAGGNHAVQGVYWAVPQATIYWMHGYEAFTQRAGQLVRPLACNLASTPPGYEELGRQSMGAFAVYAFLASALTRDGVPPIGAAWSDALEWRQDSFAVLTDGAGSVAVSWRVLFARSEVAERLAQQLGDASGRAELKLIARDAELEVLAAQDEAVLDDWTGTDPEACPEPSE